MATMLDSVHGRTVVKCDECFLTQFLSSEGLSGHCRRCHFALFPTPIEPPPALEPMPSELVPLWPSQLLAGTIRSTRLRLGLSQRQMAKKMSVPRTYVSKIENEKAAPTLPSLAKIADALEMTMIQLIQGRDDARKIEIRALLSDPFTGAVAAALPKLTQLQRQAVMANVRDLAQRGQRKTA